MDYSSAADSPVPKSFDNIVEKDDLGNFLVAHSAKCFNHCVTKIVESPLSDADLGCLKDCYAKSFLVFDHAKKAL